MTRMAIITLAGDLHAYVIRQRMQEHHGIDVAIVAVDRLAAAGGTSWHNEGDHGASLPTEESGRVDVGALDLVWWRRAHGRPAVPDSVTDRRCASSSSRTTGPRSAASFSAAFAAPG